MSNPQFQSGKEKGILYSPLGHLEIPPKKGFRHELLYNPTQQTSSTAFRKDA